MNPSLTPSGRRLPNIGDLLHRFALEMPVRTPDGAGGASLAWGLVGEVWGELRSMSGSMHLDADRLGARISHAIWLRYRPGLTPDLRLRLGTRVFIVRSILDHDGRQRYLECHCEELVT